MQQQKLGSRVDVAELKGMIMNRLGAERSKMYFYYLNRFLNQKLSKREFFKLCQRLLGRGNLSLHNQLIQSILENVCTAKTRPIREEYPSKTTTEAGQGHGRLQFGANDASGVMWVDVDNCDGKFRNQQSLAENDKDKTVPEPSRRLCIRGAADGLVSLDRINRREEQYDSLSYSSSPLFAPLGIPVGSTSVSGSRNTFLVTSVDTHLSYYNSGELSDTETLRTRMEKTAVAQHLGGVSLECANLLNRMLDMYLKRLIMSCVGLVEAKFDDKNKRPFVHQKQLGKGNYLNDMLPSNQHYMETHSSTGTISKGRPHPEISISDFNMAMELNPQQLGEDWPSIFEKICMYAFED